MQDHQTQICLATEKKMISEPCKHYRAEVLCLQSYICFVTDNDTLFEEEAGYGNDFVREYVSH